MRLRFFSSPFIRSMILVCGLLAGGQALLAGGQVLAVAVDEDVLDDPVLEAEAREIMTGIRCLVCQNQSIEDSNADLARDLRRIVRERVLAGDDDDQVRAYLVARYGDWVLLKPPFKARTFFLWFAPLIFLTVGAVALGLNLKRRRDAPASPQPLDAGEREQLKKLLRERRGK